MANQRRRRIDPEELAGPPPVNPTGHVPLDAGKTTSGGSPGTGHGISRGRAGRADADSAGMDAALGGASGPRPLGSTPARPSDAGPISEQPDPLENPALSTLDVDRPSPGAGIADTRPMPGVRKGRS
jgi:hypothetical protein